VVGSRHSQEKSMLGPYGHCFESFPSAVVKSAALLTFVCSLEVPRMWAALSHTVRLPKALHPTMASTSSLPPPTLGKSPEGLCSRCVAFDLDDALQFDPATAIRTVMELLNWSRGPAHSADSCLTVWGNCQKMECTTLSPYNLTS
jgi:hypothetical protein